MLIHLTFKVSRYELWCWSWWEQQLQWLTSGWNYYVWTPEDCLASPACHQYEYSLSRVAHLSHPASTACSVWLVTPAWPLLLHHRWTPHTSCLAFLACHHRDCSLSRAACPSCLATLASSAWPVFSSLLKQTVFSGLLRQTFHPFPLRHASFPSSGRQTNVPSQARQASYPGSPT